MAEEKGSVEQFGYKQELHRTLSLWDLTVYGLLFMVIIAPHSIFGYVNRDAQGMAPLVYLVGFCAMFFTALSYVQMAKRFPIAGSVYSYVQRGVNPHVGFLAGWLILLDYVFVPSLLYIFVGNWCQSLIPQIPGWVWILIFIAVNTAINIKGIETTARVDMFFFVVEIGIVLIIVIGGLKYVLGGGGAGELTMTPIYQADKVNLTFIATACTIAALNFTGFDGISTLAEEVSEPEKNVGRAILIALVVIGTVFFLQTYIVCLIEPDYNKFNASTALFDACAVAIGDWFRIVLLVVNILAVGIANTLNAQAACSRVLFSMGRDRLCPRQGAPQVPYAVCRHSAHRRGIAGLHHYLHRRTAYQARQLRRDQLLYDAEPRGDLVLLCEGTAPQRYGPRQLPRLPSGRYAHPVVRLERL